MEKEHVTGKVDELKGKVAIKDSDKEAGTEVHSK